MAHVRHFHRIAAEVNVEGVVRELAAHPELWDAHRARKDAPGTPHGGMSDIWVRYNRAEPFETGKRPWSEFNDLHLPEFYPAWSALPSLHPIVFALMSHVRGVMLGGILITRIPPGARIEPHADAGWHVDTFSKYYLSLKSAPGAIFGCDHDGVREELNPETGDIWEFDNHRLHWVENGSSQDRVTCIICIRTEKT